MSRRFTMITRFFFIPLPCCSERPTCDTFEAMTSRERRIVRLFVIKNYLCGIDSFSSRNLNLSRILRYWFECFELECVVFFQETHKLRGSCRFKRNLKHDNCKLFVNLRKLLLNFETSRGYHKIRNVLRYFLCILDCLLFFSRDPRRFLSLSSAYDDRRVF